MGGCSTFFIFNFISPLQKILCDNQPATGKEAKGFLPLFFLFHYGIFHIVYFVFLLVDFKLTDTNFTYLKWALGGVFPQQVIHFTQSKIKYSSLPRNIGGMFFIPYLRIVPMHLTILLPKFLGWAPALTFLLLKTVFDVLGQLITTRYYWSKDEPKPEGYI